MIKISVLVWLDESDDSELSNLSYRFLFFIIFFRRVSIQQSRLRSLAPCSGQCFSYRHYSWSTFNISPPPTDGWPAPVIPNTIRRYTKSSTIWWVNFLLWDYLWFIWLFSGRRKQLRSVLAISCVFWNIKSFLLIYYCSIWLGFPGRFLNPGDLAGVRTLFYATVSIFASITLTAYLLLFPFSLILIPNARYGNSDACPGLIWKFRGNQKRTGLPKKVWEASWIKQFA